MAKKEEKKEKAKWLDVFYSLKAKASADKKWANAIIGGAIGSVIAYGLFLPFVPVLAMGALGFGGLFIVGTIVTMWLDDIKKEKAKGSVEKVPVEELEKEQAEVVKEKTYESINRPSNTNTKSQTKNNNEQVEEMEQ